MEAIDNLQQSLQDITDVLSVTHRNPSLHVYCGAKYGTRIILIHDLDTTQDVVVFPTIQDLKNYLNGKS